MKPRNIPLKWCLSSFARRLPDRLTHTRDPKVLNLLSFSLEPTSSQKECAQWHYVLGGCTGKWREEVPLTKTPRQVQRHTREFAPSPPECHSFFQLPHFKRDYQHLLVPLHSHAFSAFQYKILQIEPTLLPDHIGLLHQI